MAKRVYLILTEAEQHDRLLETVLSQERSHFEYTSNIDRFEKMVAIMADSPERDYLVGRIKDEQRELGKTEQALDQTLKQLPEAPLLEASKARLFERMAVAESSARKG